MPVYISNCDRLYGCTDWRPTRNPRTILADIHAWIVEYEDSLVPALELTAAALGGEQRADHRGARRLPHPVREAGAGADAAQQRERGDEEVSEEDHDRCIT